MHDYLQIIDDKTLDQASAYLHDAVFRREDLKYDAAEKMVTLDLWRELYEQTQSRRIFWFLHRWTAPHRRCRLTLEGVDGCSITVTDQLDNYQVLGLKFNKTRHEITFQTACCLTIKIKATATRGSLVDLDEETSFKFNKTTVAFSSVRSK